MSVRSKGGGEEGGRTRRSSRQQLHHTLCRPSEGSLLPLWAFKCERGRKHVTCLAWSTAYSDQLAVGYGSFNYARQGVGGVAIFSLKNPSHAERSIATSSGASTRSACPGAG